MTTAFTLRPYLIGMVLTHPAEALANTTPAIRHTVQRSLNNARS